MAHDIEVARARVHVRVYDAAVMPAADQTVALRAATGVLAAAGIDIRWLECGSDVAANPADCATPLTRDELAVRLVRLAGTSSARGQLSLGYSLVDMSTGGGTLATVYVDRVEWLVSQARNSQLPSPNSQGEVATQRGRLAWLQPLHTQPCRRDSRTEELIPPFAHWPKESTRHSARIFDAARRCYD